MIYRIAVGIVVLCFMAIGFVMQNDKQGATQATTEQPIAAPAAPSNPEDAALKGFKIP